MHKFGLKDLGNVKSFLKWPKWLTQEITLMLSTVIPSSVNYLVNIVIPDNVCLDILSQL